MSTTVKTAHLNILEPATVSLSAGSEDPDYPLARLMDRNVGRLFKASLAETLEVKVDQGATGPYQSIDTLFIPAGHNLDGMTMDIKHSDDDAAYTPAVSQWVQSGSAMITKTWSPASARYWKLIITSPASAPEFAELFMSASNTWVKTPSRPAGRLDRIFNVAHATTASGQDRFLVHGAPRRRRSYRLPLVGEAQKDSLLELNESWAGAKPFWLSDHEGAWIFGRLDASMEVVEEAHERYSARFEFLEVIG